MSTNFRLPNINGRTEAQQIAQIRSFLHQLVEQLNWAMQYMEPGGENTDCLDDLQRQINELRDMVKDMQKTGG